MRTRSGIHILSLAMMLLAGAAFARADGGSLPRRPVAELEALLALASADDIVRPEPGVYEGHLRIRRAVTIEARGDVIIDGGGAGTVVHVDSAGVTLRGLVVRGSGDNVSGEDAAIRITTGPVTVERCRVEDALFGIDLRESPGSLIRDNQVRCKDLEPGRRGDGIRLWWSHECIIEGNRIDGSRDMVFWYSEGLKVTRNVVAESRYGLHFMYSHDTVLEGNELRDNSVGVYLMYSNRIRLVGNAMTANRGASGYGIGLKDCDDIVIEANALLANRVGMYVDNSPSSLGATGLIEGNLIAYNEIGFLATPNTHDNVIRGNAFIENEEQASVHGRGDLGHNVFSQDGVGNFWSDYAGFDRDGNGIGDLSHEPRSLFSSMLAREPNLRLFNHSPAQQAVEFAARTLPELRPDPTFVDASPLTRRPELEIGVTRAGAVGWPMASVAAGLGVASIGAWRVLGRADVMSRADRRRS